MNVEQRLIEVFQTSPQVEPSPDLFSRVVHSIEEDRRHRRRIVRTTATALALLAALVAVGAMSFRDGPGRLQGHVDRPTMELLQWIALAVLLVALGPAIRRFGRGYASDLWPSDAVTPVALLRLMDVAYYLVGAGYILVTAEFQFADSLANDRLAEQLAGASVRLGGLLLVLGVLHATTLFALPLMAFVHNATRADTALPRWIWLLLILLVTQVFPVVTIVVVFGASGGE
jgi:hypothetical protein